MTEYKGEIILYQPDEEVKLEVRLEEETVWLTQAQMVDLFKSSKQNISLHINNIFKEGELEEVATVKDYLTVQKEGNRNVRRRVAYYNLDVIISVGYRVKSIRGTQFRQWANKVLKEYLLKGYSVNQRLNDMERKMDSRFMEHEQRLDRIDKKIDFFVRTSLPPVEGIFYQGQIFDAYKFATGLIRSARKSVLLMLSKRGSGVTATIYTQAVGTQLRLDLERHNDQYPPIDIRTYKGSHDRFLIVDGKDIYHIGASLKDLGKRMFAFSKLEIPANVLTDLL